MHTIPPVRPKAIDHKFHIGARGVCIYPVWDEAKGYFVSCGKMTIMHASWSGYVLVHADCKTPLRGLYCRMCGLYPDMQSTEFADPTLVVESAT